MEKKVNLKSVPWAMLFAVVFVASVFGLSRFSISMPISLLIVAINSVIFGIYAISFTNSIAWMDEVQIRIQLEAVSIAFVLSLLSAMVLGLVGLIEELGVQQVNFLYIFPLFFLFYLIGLFISNLKYK